MLYNILIAPIETIVDWCFVFITNQFSSIGIMGALVGVSLVINFLALPLYNIADALQDKERKAAKQLEPRVKRIKKAFKGDEQFMMLSTYYSQNNYHPLYVLRSSLSILIEIPFFIAAYHYLSNCEALRGASFWIFKDLGAPDGLLHISIGSFYFPIHVLPILMTLINFVSGAIYTKDAVFREKIQLYGVAILFLVLLYKSPSGLVLYWILNNTFSLIKNIVMRQKHPGRILFICICAILFIVTGYYYIGKPETTWYKKLVVLLIAVIFTAIPFVVKFAKKHIHLPKLPKKEVPAKDYLLLLIFSGLGLALLCGLFLPSSVIASSTSEFCFLGNTPSPTAYIWSSFCISVGFFVFWPIVIYKMFGEKVKVAIPAVFFVMFLCALANALLFKASYGSLNVLFMIGNPDTLNLSKKIYLLSILLFAVVIAIFYAAKTFGKVSWLSVLMISFCIAEAGIGFVKLNHIKKDFKFYSAQKSEEAEAESKIATEYHLSKDGKNVVVLFLDRAVNTFVPKIFEEYPQIKADFDGFTYYPNTLSFADYTCMGTPPMMGGYEYTPENMNLREKDLLKNKNDEADLVMAKLFADAGFESTISDPPWAGYSYSGDLSNFNKYPEIKTIQREGNYYTNYVMEKDSSVVGNIDVLCKKEIVNFTTLEIIPPFLRKRFYKDCKGVRSEGLDSRNFYEQIANLYFLPQLTEIDAEKNAFLFIENQVTHDVGATLNDDLETVSTKDCGDVVIKHYQANAAAYKQLGKFFNYLKENDVYDNTRIIVVSDHGYKELDSVVTDRTTRFDALLLVKDFNATGQLKVDSTFMTNADTVFLAKEGLNLSENNPFTNKPFVQQKEHGIIVYGCVDWNAENFKGESKFTLDKKDAFHVSNDIYNPQNWKPLVEWEKSNGGAN